MAKSAPFLENIFKKWPFQNEQWLKLLFYSKYNSLRLFLVFLESAPRHFCGTLNPQKRTNGALAHTIGHTVYKLIWIWAESAIHSTQLRWFYKTTRKWKQENICKTIPVFHSNHDYSKRQELFRFLTWFLCFIGMIITRKSLNHRTCLGP